VVHILFWGLAVGWDEGDITRDVFIMISQGNLLETRTVHLRRESGAAGGGKLGQR